MFYGIFIEIGSPFYLFNFFFKNEIAGLLFQFFPSKLTFLGVGKSKIFAFSRASLTMDIQNISLELLRGS